MHNSHIIINNDGELVAIYRKLHLFDVQTDDFKFRESDVINGGDNIIAPLTNTPLSGGLGLLIVISFPLTLFFSKIIFIFFFCYRIYSFIVL